MKQFLLIALSFLILNLITNARAATGSSLKYEGTCSGHLRNGSSVSFNYYSNFNGCRKSSTGAVAFSEGLEGLHTGKRTFVGTKDIYTFPNNKIVLANSTGNTSAHLSYIDENGRTRRIQVSCDIRDYEYSEC